MKLFVNVRILVWLAVFGLAFAVLFPFALAQSATPDPSLPGLSPEATLAAVAVVAAFLAHWFTALTKGRFGTEGRTTVLIAGAFSALIGGWGAYAAGLYPHTTQGLLLACVSALFTWAGSAGIFRSNQQGTAAGVKAAEPVEAVPASGVSSDSTPHT